MNPVVLTAYKFDGVPKHTVVTRPHGNSKSNKPYRRTMSSTKTHLAAKLKTEKPKDAIDSVFQSKGGLLGAKGAGELPRGRTQAYNLNRKARQQELKDSVVAAFPFSCASASATRDVLFVVMEQCKNAEHSCRFVQEVTCAPEPMAVLCTNQQLLDIERFSCDLYMFSVFGIDPTLILGSSASQLPFIGISCLKTKIRGDLQSCWVRCLCFTTRCSATTTTSALR